MFPAKLNNLQHNIKKIIDSGRLQRILTRLQMVHPVMMQYTDFTTMSVTFKCCTIAQYTHTCHLIYAHKKSNIFTYADFHAGGIHHSIMFISLILNWQQMWTVPIQTVDSAHTNSFAPLSKAWLSMQHLSQQSQVLNYIRQTDRHLLHQI
jgi:hypothetical protein